MGYDDQNGMVLAQKQAYKSTEQNRDPRNKPRLYGQLIYHRRGSNIMWGNDSLLNKHVGKTGDICKEKKKKKLDNFLMSYTKID